MYKFFIDESGKPNLRSVDKNRPHFSLAGIIVHDNSKNALKIRADQIKFKYWGTTNIVFHANSIRQLTDDFNMFKKVDCKFTIDDFYIDFSNFLNMSYKIGLVTINKNNYIKSKPELKNAISELSPDNKKSNWVKMVKGAEKNLLKMTTTEILAMYIYYLNRKGARGAVIVESSDEAQDMDIFSSYNKILISGFTPFQMNTQAVREKLTGISFVTKQNHDIEEQLADIAAYYFNLESRLIDKLIPHYPRPGDEKVIKILKSKTFSYQTIIGGNQENSFRRLY